jgi:hypothetical protein
MTGMPADAEPIRLFSDYLRVTGVAHLGPEPAGVPELVGKRLGLLNGSSWITLWSNYFGRRYLPGVHLINMGNEALQLNFMEAHERGLPCPPAANIQAFVRYARDLVAFARVHAVLITCSTMNRAYDEVVRALAPEGIPVVQIDRPMMERAVAQGGKILVIATHGPTVGSTQALLRESAAEMGRDVAFAGTTVPAAWDRLAAGDISGHNEALAAAIRACRVREEIGCVVLAQLSMTVFLFSYPDPVAEFGVPVLTSGQCGFEHMRGLLASLPAAP